jgi:hypothetical protein
MSPADECRPQSALNVLINDAISGSVRPGLCALRVRPMARERDGPAAAAVERGSRPRRRQTLRSVQGTTQRLLAGAQRVISGFKKIGKRAAKLFGLSDLQVDKDREKAAEYALRTQKLCWLRHRVRCAGSTSARSSSQRRTRRWDSFRNG